MHYSLKSSVMGLTLSVGPIFYAQPAEVKLHPWRDGVIIQLSGRIEADDVDHVRIARNEATNNSELIIALQLDSWGGDGDGGIKLADFVYRNNFKVYVDDKCWSSCAFPALVALGRGNLMIGPDAEIGVHQVFDNGTGEADPAWTKMAAAILADYGAPQRILGEMVAQPPDSMATFQSAELARMGALEVKENWTWSSWLGD
jgi:hypothetical protein